MKSLETVWRPVGSHSRRARNVALAESCATTGERWRRRLLRERVAREKLKAASAFVRPRPALRRLKVMLERGQDFRRRKHAELSASDEMLGAACWDIAGRAMRPRSVLNDPCPGSTRSGFACAEGRGDSVMGAPWAMKVAVCLGNGTCSRHAEQRSNLRSVRSGDVELVFSEIAPLSSSTCCFLLSASSARKDVGGAIAEVAVPAMVWPDYRRTQRHFQASHLYSINRRHFLREMVAERCA